MYPCVVLNRWYAPSWCDLIYLVNVEQSSQWYMFYVVNLTPDLFSSVKQYSLNSGMRFMVT